MSDETPSGSRDRTLVRLVDLETWRQQIDAWRLHLTGAADSNGRIGTLTRTVDGLREDVGDAQECRAVRDAAGNVHAFRRRVWAAIAAAGVAVGGSAWGLVKSRDENTAAAARAAERLDRLERDIDRLESVLFLPAPGPASTHAPSDP